MCKRNLFHGVDCAGGIKIDADDLRGMPMRVKARPEVGEMPTDLGALLGLIMHGLVPDEVMKDIEKPEVVTFGEPVKLKNGKWGLKISRADKFIVDCPVKVLNGNGDVFPLIGFIRKNRKSPSHWIMATGRCYSDEYFYVETEEPRVKITLAEIEAKLGFKMEIVG